MSKRKERKFGKARAAEAEAAEEQEEKGGWLESLKSIAFAAVLFILIRTFVLQTFFITSGSMKDTMLVGDFLVVNRAAIGARLPFTNINVPGYSEPRRGDVLVFDPQHTDSLKLVKRLVGMPGDTLEMRDRVLYRNGEPQDEPYVRVSGRPDGYDSSMVWQQGYLTDDVDTSTYSPTRDTWGPLVIPEGKYFLLGDNRDESYDSRMWGVIDGWRFEGRVSFIYYSYNQESYRPFPALREIRWDRIGQRVR